MRSKGSNAGRWYNHRLNNCASKAIGIKRWRHLWVRTADVSRQKKLIHWNENYALVYGAILLRQNLLNSIRTRKGSLWSHYTRALYDYNGDRKLSRYKGKRIQHRAAYWRKLMRISTKLI